jgi:hypothetical protein
MGPPEGKVVGTGAGSGIGCGTSLHGEGEKIITNTARMRHLDD